LAERAEAEWERQGVVLLESGIEWLAKWAVEASGSFLEKVVEQEDLEWGSESRLKEQAKVEAEWE
jgi:hypothetical protein